MDGAVWSPTRSVGEAAFLQNPRGPLRTFTIRSWPLFVAAAGFAGTACTPTSSASDNPAPTARSAWPDDEPDLYNVKLADGVVFATDEQVQKVRVEPGRLIFPASSVADVQAQFPMGKPLVGGPSTENVAQNPFGFMRKVTGVRTEGDSVIVDTEKAPLQDVVVGEFRATIDPDLAEEIILPPEVDLSQYFEDVDVGPGLPPPAFDGSGQPLSFSDANRGPSSSVSQAINDNVSVTEAFSIPPITVDIMSISTRKTVGTGNRAVTVAVTGNGKLTSDFFFQPRLSLAFETSLTSGLDYFQAKAEGTYRSKTVLDVNIGVTATAGTEPARLVGLQELLNEGPDVGRGPTLKLAESRPYRGPRIYGIPTTFRVKLYADCGWTIQGSMNVRAENTIDTYMAAGIRYTDDDGWKPISALNFGRSSTVQLTAGGGAAVECGVSARVEWLVGDVGGPYLGIRAAAKAFGAYGEMCNLDAPANGRPNGAATLKVNAGIEVQVGGSMDAWRVVRFEKGPYNLYALNYEVWSRRYDFPGAGMGYCLVDCGNGTKSRLETDVDCGGPNCNDCAGGKSCAAGTDCVSGICSLGGRCVNGPCEDGIQNNGERNVDCGGPCGGCGDGNVCDRPSECSSNVCAADGICVAGTWADLRVNGGESDVDCGSAVFTKCDVGKRCSVAGDCASGACNTISGACVANACQDGVRGPGEADVDCGGTCGPCAAGSGCLVAEDCTTGVCNTVTNRCVASLCEDGIRSGMETDVDCGGECPGCGEGGQCTAVEDCAGGLVCSARQLCTMPGCNDGLKNGNESSADCGGSTCSVCSSGKTCNTAADCFSNKCGANGICVDTLCQDGVRNGTESDVDCGRDCGVYKCASGKSCTDSADCASGVCVDNRCVSDPCLDRLRNGTEGDVDCGGACSTACATGRSCNVATDCQSGVCNAVTRTCVASTCLDGVLTAASETDVDCGNACADCANGRRCSAGSDCASGICNALTGRCAADTCSNGARDGNETDVDCGGSCERKCLFQRACVTGGDCLSGTCVAGSNTCALDQCSDARTNGSESDVDCGGTCDVKCAVDKGCRTNADCQNPSMVAGEAGFCSPTSFTCLTSSCTSGVKDGDETGLDCGGSCGLCPVGQGCALGSDCASTFCNATTRVCVATQCQDGATNGGETDVDCGGPCTNDSTEPRFGIGKCAVNAVCALPQDCQSGYCSSGRCVAPIPRSCAQIYDSGMRIDQAYTLDPDGPPWTSASPFGPQQRGRLPPVPYQCDMTNGGWTNVWMLNSQYANGQGGFGYLGTGIQFSNGMHPRAASIQNSGRGQIIAPLANSFMGPYFDGMPWTEMRFAVYVQGADFWTSKTIYSSQILLGWNTSGVFLANDCPAGVTPGEFVCNQPYDWCMGRTSWWSQGNNDMDYTNCSRRIFVGQWPMQAGTPGVTDPDDLIAFGVQPNPWGGVGSQVPSSPRGPFTYTFRSASRFADGVGSPGIMYWTTPSTPNDGYRGFGPGGVNSRAHNQWGGVIAIWAR